MSRWRWGVLLLGVAVVVAAAWFGNRARSATQRNRATAAADSAAADEHSRRDRDIVFYERRAAADPISAGDRAQLAALYLRRAREGGDYGDVLRAEELARESLTLRSTHNADVNATLILSLMEQHRFAEARDVGRRLVAENPSNTGYRALLGEVSLEVGDYAGARAAFDSLPLDSRTSFNIAPRLARWLEILGNNRGARRILYRAMAAADSSPDLSREQVAWFHLRVGDIEMRNGRLRGAESALRSGRDVMPQDYRLMAAQARLAALKGDWRRAISLGDSSIAISLDPGTLGLIGDAYLALGDSVKAREYMKTMEVAIAAEPGAYHRASGLHLLDRGEQVDEVAARAREEMAARKDIYGFDLLAWALHKQGRHREALQAMTQALRLGTRDASLFYHAGMIHRALGSDANAATYLKAALDVNPFFDPRHPRTARAVLDSLER